MYSQKNKRSKSAWLIVAGGILAGILGAIGGQIAKRWRRLGIPITLCLISFPVLGWHCLWYWLFLLPLSLGYGRVMPDDPDPSAIGLWVHDAFGLGIGNDAAEEWEDSIIRGIIGFIYCLCLIPIAVVSHNWLAYAAFCVFFCGFSVNYEALGKDIPDIKIGKFELLSEELIRYAILGACALAVGIL